VGPLSLTGGDQCGDRGCVDNHCCVDDASGDNAVDADGSGSGESAAEEVQRQIEETQRQLNEDAEKATAKALKEAETEASPDLESETHPQPSQASPVGDHRGVDCWDKCGQAPGRASTEPGAVAFAVKPASGLDRAASSGQLAMISLRTA